MTAKARAVPREEATVTAPLSSVRDDDDGAPKVIKLTSGKRKPARRVPLFSIDDDTYTIAAEAKTNDSLRYLDIMRKKGSEAAIGFMMETLVGPEGWQALQDYDDLTDDDLAQIIAAAAKIMNGPMEDPKEP